MIGWVWHYDIMKVGHKSLWHYETFIEPALEKLALKKHLYQFGWPAYFQISVFPALWVAFPAFPYLVISVLHKFPNLQLFQILKFPGFTFRDFKIVSLDFHFMHLQHFCYLQFVQLSSSKKKILLKAGKWKPKFWKLRTMQKLETGNLERGNRNWNYPYVSFFQGLAQTKLQFSGKESEFFPLSKRHLSLKKHLINFQAEIADFG